jgi:4-amino-4-deoxy-L-arabinose transferase-like glycosyltransferase
LAFIVLLFLFLIYVVYAVALLRFPFDYDQGEGFELWDAVMFSRGEWIYRDNEAFPFYSSNYGPLFPLLLAPLVKIFGPKLWVGRAFSFLTTLVIGGTIFWIVRRETRERTIAALAALVFFGANIVYQIGPLFRLHMTMVMFGLLGIAFMARFEEEKQGRRNLWLAMLFLLAAGYTKQLAFDAGAAAFLFLFLRRPKQAVLYGVGFAATVALIFILLNLATDGQWWFNAIVANANPFIPGQSEAFYRQWLGLYTVILLLALGYTLWTLYVDRISVYSLYFVLAVAKGALSGKWGAGPGYFITSIVAACIAAGIGLGLFKQWVSRRATVVKQQGSRAVHWRYLNFTFATVVPLLFLFQARLNLHFPLEHPLTRPVAKLLQIPAQSPHRFRQEYYDSVGYTQLGHLPNSQDIAAGWEIVNWIRATSVDGPTWSEEAMFTIWAEQEHVITNPTQLYNLWNLGKLDVSEMVRMIDSQSFGLVIFRAQFYPPPVLNAIGQNYDVVAHIPMNGFTYALLRPKAR